MMAPVNTAVMSNKKTPKRLHWVMRNHWGSPVQTLRGSHIVHHYDGPHHINPFGALQGGNWGTSYPDKPLVLRRFS